MSTFVKDILGGYKNIKMLSVERKNEGNIWKIRKMFISLHRNMAESVDALVSNTSGVTSIPVRPRVWVQIKRLSN